MLIFGGAVVHKSAVIAARGHDRDLTLEVDERFENRLLRPIASQAPRRARPIRRAIAPCRRSRKAAVLRIGGTAQFGNGAREILDE